MKIPEQEVSVAKVSGWVTGILIVGGAAVAVVAWFIVANLHHSKVIPALQEGVEVNKDFREQVQVFYADELSERQEQAEENEAKADEFDRLKASGVID